jgi:hypothetical protein
VPDTFVTGVISAADTGNAALAAGAISSTQPAGNSFVIAALGSMPTVGITLKPAVTAGALAVEGSADGTNWTPLSAQASGATSSALTTTGNTFLRVNTATMQLVRVRAVTGTAFGAGNIAVSIEAASDAGMVTTVDSGAGSGGGSVTQGTTPWVVSMSNPVPDVTASGTISGNTSVALTLTGQASVSIQAVNTGFTGVLNFEVSDDAGTTYHPLLVTPVGTTSDTPVASITFTADSSSNLWGGNVAALDHVRVRGSSVTLGSSAVALQAGASSNGGYSGPIPTGTNNIGTTIAQGTLTDASGTITAGGTAQVATAASANRKYLLIVNPLSATETLYFNFTTTAVAASPSIALAAGDSYESDGSGFVSTEALSVIAATTGHAYILKVG